MKYCVKKIGANKDDKYSNTLIGWVHDGQGSNNQTTFTKMNLT